jgi:hypothetical protein
LDLKLYIVERIIVTNAIIEDNILLLYINLITIKGIIKIDSLRKDFVKEKSVKDKESLIILKR